MTSQTIVRLVNGGTIAVREGILRGVGPQGPRGDEGPAGPPFNLVGSVANAAALPANGSEGDAYLADDTGHLYFWNTKLIPSQWVDAGRYRGDRGDLQSPGAKTFTSPASTVSGTSWQVLPLGTFEYNDDQNLGVSTLPLAVLDGTTTELSVQHPEPTDPGMYQFTAEVEITTQAGSTPGWRTVGIFKNGTLFNRNAIYDPGVDNTPLYLSTTAQARTNGNDAWTVRLLANDTANVLVDLVELTVSRLGGGIGVQGVQGPQGTRGIQGVQGPIGSAAGGFADYDGVTGGGRNSTTDPAGTPDTTAEQGFPVPGGLQRPHTPFFIKALATVLERYVIGRFDSFADVNARSASDPGELMFNRGTSEYAERGLFLRTDLAADAIKVPLVRYDTTAPATVTTDPDGTIFLVYEA